jgi:hypothetical protein
MPQHGNPTGRADANSRVPRASKPPAFPEKEMRAAKKSSKPEHRNSGNLKHHRYTQHSAFIIHHPSSIIHHPASSIQHPASSIQHSAFSIQH